MLPEKVKAFVPAALLNVIPAVVRLPPRAMANWLLALAALKTRESALAGTVLVLQFEAVPHAPVAAPPSQMIVAERSASGESRIAKKAARLRILAGARTRVKPADRNLYALAGRVRHLLQAGRELWMVDLLLIDL